MSFYTSIRDEFETTIKQSIIKDASEHFQVLQTKMPHIAREFQKRWGFVSLGNYMSKVMFDTRDDKRIGFPKDVADAMWAISKANNDEHNLHRYHEAPIRRSTGEWSMEDINR